MDAQDRTGSTATGTAQWVDDRDRDQGLPREMTTIMRDQGHGHDRGQGRVDGHDRGQGGVDGHGHGQDRVAGEEDVTHLTSGLLLE